jgi:hypothetical protein
VYAIPCLTEEARYAISATLDPLNGEKSTFMGRMSEEFLAAKGGGIIEEGEREH